LNNEATVYLTHFKADAASTVNISSLFPIEMAFSPGFKNKTFTQYRGVKWFNVNDCMGFVSPVSLPVVIASNKFILSDSKSYTASAGQWFSPAAVVVYVYQSHEQTDQLKDTVNWQVSDVDGQITLTFTSSSGSNQVSLF
jgi:hypothetical protein